MAGANIMQIELRYPLVMAIKLIITNVHKSWNSPIAYVKGHTLPPHHHHPNTPKKFLLAAAKINSGINPTRHSTGIITTRSLQHQGQNNSTSENYTLSPK